MSKRFFFLVLCIACIGVSTIFAEGNFKILSSGEITVDGYLFANMNAYMRSDYFRSHGKRCLIKRRPESARQGRLVSDCDLDHTVIKEEYWNQDVLIIPVIFHVIMDYDSMGNIADQFIYDQMTALNEDYRAIAGTRGENGFDTRIQFDLVGITRTINNRWFNDLDEVDFKRNLGWNPQRFLNVYTNTASGFLGYSYLPQDENGMDVDGVVMLFEVIGGRDNGYDFYDQGRTLVHEIGHYLGLLHPFESYDCENGYDVGDLINDTYSENEEHYDCILTQSCGTPDNITNYMGYTDDVCMEEFTPEQANRMVCSILNYRSRLLLPFPPADSLSPPVIIQPLAGDTLSEGDSLFFQGQVEIERMEYQFHWDFGNGNISSQKVPGYVMFHQAGDYQVSFWYEYEGRISDSCRVTVTVQAPIVAIKASDGASLSGMGPVVVSPNPIRRRVAITLPSGIGRELTVRLYDVLGRELFSNQGRVTAGGDLLEIDFDQTLGRKLPAGVYFIVCQSPTETAITKVMLIR